MDDHKIPPVALLLSLAGLVPFVAGAAMLLSGVRISVIDDPARALLGYGAVILSFLGGVRWGFALRISDPGLQTRAFVIAVSPAIIAWLLLLLPTLMGLVMLPIFFLLRGVADEQLPGLGAPEWYRRLRRGMTATVVLVLLAAIIGLVR